MSDKKTISENKEIWLPVFPNKSSYTPSDGLLLMDFFASKAMEAMIIKGETDIAEKAYQLANEMMGKRNKTS